MRSDKMKKVALSAMLASFALMLTFVEAVLPVNAVIPIPGFRLGLANIAVMLTLFYLGRTWALGVVFVKVTVCAVLFSNPMSALFSAAGSALSLSILVLISFLPKLPFGFVGISVLSALFHNLGQAVVAFAFFGSAVLSLAPYLAVVSLLSGVLTGLLLCSVSPTADRLFINKNGK